MNESYIFAHRGGMGYCIENTLDGFQKAVNMRVGIESDIRITKDKNLICFHDPFIKLGENSYLINKITLEELKGIPFKDERKIPTVIELFDAFITCPHTFRYSFDIANKKIGLALIELVEKYSYFNRVEITDTRIQLLRDLRNHNKSIKLVYTIPYNIIKLNEIQLDFEKLHEDQIKVLNIKNNRASEGNFKSIIDNGFKCYCWGVNSRNRMKKILNLRYKTECVSAIYTNYPAELKQLRDKLFN